MQRPRSRRSGVAPGVQSGSLRVDARGNAEIAWSAGGARRTLLVPLRGKSLPGGKLSGADVSRAASAPIPFRKVVRRTPDGWLWALQAWSTAPGGPVELRFSRWQGAPMTVTLAAEPKYDTELLTGGATFAGTPAAGYSVTPEGTRVRVTAYVDCFCGGVWTRISGVAVRADGSFRLLVRKGFLGARYRAIVTGPTRATTQVPDGMAVATSSR